MGDCYRDEIRKTHPRLGQTTASAARPRGSREAAEKRSKAIQRQQSRQAVRPKAKETQMRMWYAE